MNTSRHMESASDSHLRQHASDGIGPVIQPEAEQMRHHDVERDRSIIAAAWPGPWLSERDGSVHAGDNIHICETVSAEDAEFIASARTHWPAALDALQAARQEIVRLQALIDAIRPAAPRKVA